MRAGYKSRFPPETSIQQTAALHSTMNSFSASQMSTAGVLLLVFAAAHGQGGWEIHGDQHRSNGQDIQKLGGSISGQRDRLAVDGMRAGDYERGQVEYGRQLMTDGTRSLNGHVGLGADNMGNRAKNFGLGYQDPKNSATWDRSLTGPVRTDTFRAERNFFTSPDGRGTINGYVQHERNNFGHRNSEGGIVGRWGFGR